jgi:hypothetical protein
VIIESTAVASNFLLRSSTIGALPRTNQANITLAPATKPCTEVQCPHPHPWITTGVHVGVSLLNVNVRGTGDDVSDRTASIEGGVSVGFRVGGVGIYADWDGGICPPWWPWPGGPRGLGWASR